MANKRLQRAMPQRNARILMTTQIIILRLPLPVAGDISELYFNGEWLSWNYAKRESSILLFSLQISDVVETETMITDVHNLSPRPVNQRISTPCFFESQTFTLFFLVIR